ncbi:MAG: hypothetical protein PHI28_13475 [Mangrovibacterium sp.]|nr:hypothetical protein [Mangrovibacterium sp.]
MRSEKYPCSAFFGNNDPGKRRLPDKNARPEALVSVLGCLILCFNLSCKEKPRVNPSVTDQKSVAYSLFNSYDEMISATDIRYFEPVRISPVGTKEKPLYHNFFYYNHTPTECLQFEPTGRYLLGMRFFMEGREVQPSDKAEIGIFDLQCGNTWEKIGETTAWNWQQGCRLQWIPGSFEEIMWNDHSADGKTLITKVYSTKTKTTRIIPFPVYVTSPNGKTGLGVNYERVQHRGCKYPGVEDPYKDEWAPGNTGLWKIDMSSGALKLVVSIRDIAKGMYPDGFPSDTLNRNLYFFRAGYNPSGSRIFIFVKDFQNRWGNWTIRTEGYTVQPDGTDVRYFYREPSHHYWLNDEEVLDNGYHASDGEKASLGFFRFKDDGTGQAKEKVFGAPNGHITIDRTGDWVLNDASDGDGHIYLYLYHLPTRKFIPLAKLETRIGGYIYRTHLAAMRTDLHPRFSHDGKTISFDSTHEEDFGRQIYIMDVSQIVDNPPQRD